MKRKICVSTSSFGKYDERPIRMMEDKGLEVALNPHARKLDESEISSFLNGAIGLVAGTENLSGKVLSSLPLLKVISRCGVGTDNIDLDTASKLGIKVFNTPDGPTVAVAELTLGLILAVLRHIVKCDMSIRDNEWKKYMGTLLCGKTVGIIGLGRIGKSVAKLLIPFGTKVCCSEPEPDRDFIKEYGIKILSLKELLACSDIVTLHLKFKERQGYFIGKDEIGLMKKNSFLINVARGNLVDENALVEALKNNKIKGAGLDVYEKEPYNGPLKELKNVVLTSHIGSYAEESRVNMEIEAVKNLIKGLNF